MTDPTPGVRGPFDRTGAGVELSDADPVHAALLATFREVLGRVAAAERFGNASDPAMGAALRAACADARGLRIPITHLLLTLKAAWHSPPAQRRAGWLDAEAALTRVVTSCIRDYYGPDAPGDVRPAALATRRGGAPRVG